MNPYTGLRSPTAAFTAGSYHGRAHSYLIAARSWQRMGHKNFAATYARLARESHHKYLRSLRDAREE